MPPFNQTIDLIEDWLGTKTMPAEPSPQIPSETKPTPYIPEPEGIKEAIPGIILLEPEDSIDWGNVRTITRDKDYIFPAWRGKLVLSNYPTIYGKNPITASLINYKNNEVIYFFETTNELRLKDSVQYDIDTLNVPDSIFHPQRDIYHLIDKGTIIKVRYRFNIGTTDTPKIMEFERYFVINGWSSETGQIFATEKTKEEADKLVGKTNGIKPKPEPTYPPEAEPTYPTTVGPGGEKTVISTPDGSINITFDNLGNAQKFADAITSWQGDFSNETFGLIQNIFLEVVNEKPKLKEIPFPSIIDVSRYNEANIPQIREIYNSLKDQWYPRIKKIDILGKEFGKDHVIGEIKRLWNTLMIDYGQSPTPTAEQVPTTPTKEIRTPVAVAPPKKKDNTLRNVAIIGGIGMLAYLLLKKD